MIEQYISVKIIIKKMNFIIINYDIIELLTVFISKIQKLMVRISKKIFSAIDVTVVSKILVSVQ